MTKVPVFSKTGEKVGEQQLPDGLFNLAMNAQLVSDVIRVQRANRRVAIAHSKTRGEVRGGGKKPWRQKGTGRARHGSIRSPIWKGGGVTHGPRSNRNYTLKINAKVRRRALAMTLSDKVKENAFVVVENLTLEQPKTKLLTALLAKLPVTKPILFAQTSSNSSVYRASRNLKGIETIRADSLNVEAVVGARTVVADKAAVDRMLATFAKGAA